MQNYAKSYKEFVRVASLSVEQESAITLLLTGMSDQSVATRLKRSRATINRWRLYHPLFKAELNRRRRFQRESGFDAVRSLIPSAAQTLRDNIVNGDGRLALDFLARFGVLGTTRGAAILEDTGPTDLTGILDEEIRLRRADGRLPTPAAPAPPASSANGEAGAQGPAPAPEPPVTDEERDLVLAELLAAAESESLLDLPSDTPAAPSNGPVVTSANLS